MTRRFSTTSYRMPRFQVTETKHGYAVKDTEDGSIWTKTYTRLGDAANRAMKLNEAHHGF